ncbi:hypothetical protein QUF79_00145 [Fictibacillus enclensis]|uniref:hypothetical protein n=1 Tax=Fictibacillus enclensis TaxID=1017270 RepID=UPI0025A2E896|nr:hypothetical protein [Fictibacillus enclensis]MDM5196511.1 hypothetical protein [Fictibacillus enclensis]
MSFQLALVKEIGGTDVVLAIGNQEFIVPLKPEEAKGLHQVLLNRDEVLVPFNVEDNKLEIESTEFWFESNVEELQGNDEAELDDEGKVL